MGDKKYYVCDGASLIGSGKKVRAAGYEISKDGLNSCIKDCHNSARLEELNEQLNDKLAELKNVLTVNALLVKKGQHRVKQSIRILSGHNLSNAVSSYSRQGSIDSPEESKHSLAQA